MSCEGAVVEINQASKCYNIYSTPADRLKQFFVPKLRSWLGLPARGEYFREFWSLRGVSLSVRRGEVLGLVGVNGAGKSTLLQLICGVLEPTAGSVKVHGRVAALLELGAGFNPEFSGRENIFLNAALLGLTQEETSRHLDEIIEFSGLSEFIDQPVKTYSSGMYVRLAFAIATSVHPDILIIDEALSVGDGAFARKSFDRILAMRDRGVTIIFCSHSLFQVDALCTRALWLDAGRVRELGPVAQVTASYQEHLDRISQQPAAGEGSAAFTSGGAPKGYARMRQVRASCDGVAGKELAAVSGLSEVQVDFSFDSDPLMPAPSAAVAITAADGRLIASCGSWLDGGSLLRDGDGRGTVTVRLASLPLLKGRYGLSAYLFCERGLHIYTAAEGIATLNVTQQDVEQGLFHIPRAWHFEPGYELAKHDACAAKAQGLGESDSLPVLRLTDDWSERWETRWATRQDLPALQQLFSEAFKHEMHRERWLWKYKDAIAWGTAVERDGRLVGFYGGMPRPCALRGERLQSVQVGDVMVSPDERSAGRSGPLMRASASYIDNMPDLYPGFSFAFGFPSERPMRLGVALGLYRRVESIHEIAWSPLAVRRSLLKRTRLIPNDAFSQYRGEFNALWSQMQSDFAGFIVPVRDYDRWLYRYARHPEITYRVVLISDRLWHRPLAAFVLAEHADFVELVDYVGGAAGVGLAVNRARQFATMLAKPALKGWFTGALAPLFSAHSSSINPTGIEVPTNLRGRTEEQAVLPAPLWLMAGDSDFR